MECTGFHTEWDLPRMLLQHRCSPGQALGRNEPCAHPWGVPECQAMEPAPAVVFQCSDGPGGLHWGLPTASVCSRGEGCVLHCQSVLMQLLFPVSSGMLLLRGHRHRVKGCKELPHFPKVLPFQAAVLNSSVHQQVIE